MTLNPILVPDDKSRFSIREGHTFVADLNTVDPAGGIEGEGLTYSIVGGLDPEFFTIDPHTGRLSFITAPDFENPQDEGANNVYNIVVEVTNSAGLSDRDRYAVVVLDDPGDNPNQAPEVVDDSAVTTSGEPVEIDVLGNDSDPDGDSLTIDSFSQPTNGTVSFINDADPAQGLVFTPDADFVGTDSFTTVVSDSNGGTTTSTVTIDVASANQAPVVTDDSAEVFAGDSVTIDVLANDSDPDGDTLMIDDVSLPSIGMVTFNGDRNQGLIYTPNEDFTGAGVDSFTYTVSDGNGGTAAGTVTVDILPSPVVVEPVEPPVVDVEPVEPPVVDVDPNAVDAIDDLFITSRATTRLNHDRTSVSLRGGRNIDFASFNGNEITLGNADENGVHFEDGYSGELFDLSFDVLLNDLNVPGNATIQVVYAETVGLTNNQQYDWEVEDGTKLKLFGISSPEGRSNTPIVNSEVNSVVKYAIVDNNGDTLDTATFTLMAESFLISSPITLDLGGDGIQTIGISQGVQFDLLNTGYTVTTGWLSGDDAFLATDDNGNGIIDDRSELFGGGVGEGFAELATFDSNNDGVVNAQDERFGELLIWQDINEDGITNQGELMTLEASAIASIDTGYKDVFSLDSQGNVHGEVGSASLADGSSIDVVDVYFQYDSSVASQN